MLYQNCMKKFTLVLLALVMVFSFAGVAIVGAQGAFDPSGQTVPDLDDTELFELFGTIADWIFTVLVVVSVFMILIAAFQFVTGGDNPETLSSARQKIIWAAVGIVIALLARAIPNLIISTLGPAV